MGNLNDSVKTKYSGFIDSPLWISLYNNFKKFLYGEEDSLVQKINNEILQNLDIIKKEHLNVCDIWWSDGKRISHILSYMNWLFKNHFDLDFCDQSKICVDMFDISTIKDFCNTVKYASRFEDMHLIQKYDLIFLIHSIFTFGDKGILEKVLNIKNELGNIIIVSNWIQSFLAWLKKLVDSDYVDKRMEINDIIQYLDTNKIKYTKKYFKTVWGMDRLSYNANMKIILDWISLGQYDEFQSDKKILIEKYINNNSVVWENWKRIFVEEEIVLII